jgi:hypothetical protein
MQHDRVEVDPIGPYDGTTLRVHSGLTKEVGIVERLEDGALMAPRHELPLLDEPVIERHAHDVRPRDLNGENMRDAKASLHGTVANSAAWRPGEYP